VQQEQPATKVNAETTDQLETKEDPVHWAQWDLPVSKATMALQEKRVLKVVLATTEHPATLALWAQQVCTDPQELLAKKELKVSLVQQDLRDFLGPLVYLVLRV